MPTFLDFEKEITSGKLRNVYFVAAADSYFVSRAGELLREKLFGSKESKDNYFVRYGDEDSAAEILDLCNNFSSLFSTVKLVIVKRSERLSKKLEELTDYASHPDKDTTLLLAFDKEYVTEKKLDKQIDFYDFSALPDKAFLDWVKKEFVSRGCPIDEDALELFISMVPQNFDLISSEAEKICVYADQSEMKTVNSEIIKTFIGYSTEFSPDELMSAIIHKNATKSLEILDNLLNKSGLNEIFLLSIITNYYLDLISFKTRGFASGDNYAQYGKYKMWGERLRFAKTHHNLLNENQLKYSLIRLLDTDQKLKTTMLDSKVLLASLIEDLVKA